VAPSRRGNARAVPPPDDPPHGVAAEAAAWACAHFHAPPPIAGVWVDEGADVYATPPGPTVARASYGLRDGSGWVRVLAGNARVTHIRDLGRPRRILVRVGAHEVPMLQLRDPDAPRGVVTLRAASPPERAALLDTLAREDRAAFEAIEAVLPYDEETVAARVRGTRPPTGA
jgi:hypothetical protein